MKADWSDFLPDNPANELDYPDIEDEDRIGLSIENLERVKNGDFT